ncbi:MAG TPA: phospho-N-acetylmuramoyl-pentapeptide-transferase [Anaerolineaceae bacterium]|jgi:phospho-N-acetylmuramoyl-pentapeptide-transferase|nr:phospho-N-acetylmuramoyl-pentapeptide-transferase [Anaerolineaceae bacterium]HQJ32293.1 phospho-N-acetylmuramoyl-pentapeptide-transferase [Anaerolineaceae bacterium]
MRGSSLAIAISSISFLLTVIWGSPFIRLLRNLNIGKIIRIDVPESHMAKMNTPTMGGFMFLIPVTLLTVILNAVSLFGSSRLIGSSILVPLAAMWGFALIGAVDDWEGIRGPRRGLGMRGRTKFLLQCLVALVIAYALKEILVVPHLLWPTSPEPLNMGWFYLIVAAFFIVAYSNAINLTDGIDGLAGMISIVAFGGYGVIALLQGQVYLGRFCFCIIGALAGFLWFNGKPAALYMGDTGSQALGATLAVIALMTGRWLFLPLIAIIPTAEALSVIIQVLYFRATGGKRIFKKTPVHHHFEMIGWEENQIVMRFFLIEMIGAMLGLSLTFMS